MGFLPTRAKTSRRLCTRLAALVVGVLLTQDAGAQIHTRWFGTWIFNPAKSIDAGQAPFKKGTLKIEPSSDLVKITYELFRERGGVTHLEWTGQFDGRDYPLQGVDEYSVTNAYRRLDDHSYEIVQKVDGTISTTATISIATDEKTLTTVTRGTNALGEAVTTKTVYEKR